LINGQDAVFSQFYHNPISTNSALTGVFNGKNRVGTIYRNQWYSVEPNASLTTTDLFYDSKINVLKNDFLGIGIMLFDDRAGLAEIAKTHGYLNLAYSKHLYNNKYRELNQYLVFGAQFGYGVTYLKSSGFLFGSQFDKLSETVDPSLPSGENLLTSKVYPDINTGLVWYYTSRKSTLYLGVAVSHLNRPDISLVDGSVDRLYMQYSGLIGGEFSLVDNLSVLPAIYFNAEGQVMQGVLGTNFRYEYYEKDKNAFRIGIWTRVTNTISGFSIPDIIFSTILEFNDIELGLSYDVTVSNLSAVNGYKGAFELSLIYIWGDNPEYHSLKCPRF